MAATRSHSSAKKAGAPHPSTRAKGGRPPRQRHAHAAQRASAAAGNKPRRWSHEVMEHSDAMDLAPDIFKSGSAHDIAESLKRSSTRSKRRKGTPFQSAMSMLNFYINRAGRNLPKARRDTLQRAKRELRVVFGRAP
ncbi:DUF3175 domain-containing protein [Paraburkholderia solisilvae]|uniref:DUF3175 domain-containing protein n=1 Tax=Paraburkholderia solisilvae TaxID=624376 RepID=A0A6J5E4Q0_9BURK|nr:DUF3175 domain-containing protein [Paraburkholderia solisilvae]CAB3761469.1 hypothetical protein LMG29739_03645 [Paraburkholderia solisilvae]